MEKTSTFLRRTCIIFLFVFFQSNHFTFAQCAGIGNTTPYDICDYTNPAHQSFNLFSLLSGTYTPGGVWNDDNYGGGLDYINGVLNIHEIKKSGTYHYTYTAPGCTDNTATVTINVGAYAGVPHDGPFCEEGPTNLFDLFDYDHGNLGPQINGHWYNITLNSPISGNTLPADSYNITGITTYNLSYTVPGAGSCPSSTIYVNCTVVPKVKCIKASDIEICADTDLSQYKNVNLFDYFSSCTLGGFWEDLDNTGQITASYDSHIDIQKLYAQFGAGTYRFKYSVESIRPICNGKSETILVIIEDPVDFSGAILDITNDICESEISTTSFGGIIKQIPAKMPNGTYIIEFNVNGGYTYQKQIYISNGIGNFSIPSLLFPAAGTYTVKVTRLEKLGSLGICKNLIPDLKDKITIYPLPNFDSAILEAKDICINSAAVVDIKNATNLADGNYTITYNLSGTNTATNQSIIINVVGGVSSFTIPASLLTHSGITTVTITSITNTITGCKKAVNKTVSFNIIELPDPAPITLSIKDICKGSPAVVLISGLGTITSVQLNYQLTGANNHTGTFTVPVTGGNASYTIPATELTNVGLTTFELTYFQNVTTSCGSVIVNKTQRFIINDVPNPPLANNQSFCESENATIANLTPQGSQYTWYSASTGGNPLSSSQLLTGNTTYYVSEKNAQGCESDRTAIVVTIHKILAPTLVPNGETFCGRDKPTLQQLSANTSLPNTIVWYDAQTNGNLLPNTTLLVDGTTYYGFQKDNQTGCLSKIILAVTVVLTNCDVNANFFIPDGFSPNDDGVNDVFHIPDIEFVYPNYTIQIFNRYGTLLFEGNKTNDWNGKSSTSTLIDGIVPNGVYFYVINFNKDNTPPKQGRLYLNR